MSATTVSLLSEEDLKRETAPRHASVPVHAAPVVRKKAQPHPKPAPRPIPREARPVAHSKPAPRLVKKSPVKPAPKVHKKTPVRKKVLEKKKLTAQRALQKTEASQARKVSPKVRHLLSKNAVPAPVRPNVPVKMDMEGAQFPSYLQRLLISRIRSNWAPPPGSHGLNVTLSFVLKKDGSLAEDPILVTRSGSRIFDDAAKFAILRSVPFPPFPSSFRKDKEVVTVTLQATKRQGF